MKRRVLVVARVLMILGLLLVPGSSLSFAQTGGGQQQGTIGNGNSQDSSGLVVVGISGNVPCSTSLSLVNVDSSDTRLEGTFLCGDRNAYDPYVLVGDGVEATVTVRNTSNHVIVMQRLQVSGRGPNAHAKAWNAPNVDWPAATNITLQPGQQYSYDQLQHLNVSPGDYFGETTFQDTSGQWHGISPFPRVWFTSRCSLVASSAPIK